jgi:hypothetical protein
LRTDHLRLITLGRLAQTSFKDRSTPLLVDLSTYVAAA